MSLYRKQGRLVWTYEFVFNGRRIQESSGTQNKGLARTIERNRRRELEEGRAGIVKPKALQTFSEAAAEYIEMQAMSIPETETRGRARTLQIDRNNLKHLAPFFGKTLICDISPMDVAKYQRQRTQEGAAPTTVNNEMGTFRSVMTKSGNWARLLPEVNMMEANYEVGRALSDAEIDALLEACLLSESRALYPYVFLLIETGSRPGTALSLPWSEVDFEGKGLRWGRDKTKAGTGRTIPVSQRAMAVLEVWAENFPNRKPEHFVFPSERYRQPKNHQRGTLSPYITDPTKPVVSLRRSWETALERAAWILAGRPVGTPPPFHCRFHDLRHTACTRMMQEKTPIPVIAQLVGWSPTTMWEMAQKYGHFDQHVLRNAVETISAKRESLPKSLPYTPRHLAHPM